MKKFLAAFLGVVLMMGSFPAFSMDSKEQVAVDLSKLSVIKQTVLKASDKYKKSGYYTAGLKGNDIYKTIKLPCRKDWSRHNTLEFWVYSPNSLDNEITIALISDDKTTPGLDYYVADAYVYNQGWNNILLSYNGKRASFFETGNPKGFDRIDRIEIWTQYEGKVPDAGMELYFDKMILTTKEIIPEQNPQADEEASDEVVVWENCALKESGAGFGAPKISDWTSYNTLRVEMHSEAASMRSWWFVLLSSNPETTGEDYLYKDLKADFKGDKVIEYDLRYGGAWCKAGTPNGGWSNITGLTFWEGSKLSIPQNGQYDNVPTNLLIKKIVLTNKDWEKEIFGEEAGNYMIEAMCEDSFVDYVSMIEERYNGENAHPRLIIDNNKLNDMKELIKTDSYMIKSYARLINTVERSISTGFVTIPNPQDAPRLIPVALAYNLTGDERYKEWIWESVLNITKKIGAWTPNNSDYLSAGDTMRSIAYTYDWMYNTWTEEQRRIVRNAMVHFGIEATMHHARSYERFTGNTGGNWNQIILSGFGLVGLALAGDGEEYKDIANETINRAIQGLKFGYPKTISPYGDYMEGVGYWSYGMKNYIPWLAALYNACGTTGGLMELPGMRESGNFPIGTSGPTGFYNFADTAGSGYVTVGGYFFLSDYYNDPMYGAFQLNYTKAGGGDWDSMVMYTPKKEYSNFLDYMPSYTYTKGNNEVVTLRHSWIDENASFLGAKGGSTATWHDHMDAGSWIYDFLGVRWAIELGRDSYIGLNRYEDGKYAFYRNRAEGQNTLVINPDGKPEQNRGEDAYCPVKELNVTDTAAYVIMDLTPAYEGRGANSVTRGFIQLNNFGSLLIRDEIESSKPLEVYSFMHTKADIEVAPDGRSAVLTQNQKKMRVRLLDESSGKLVAMEADPLPLSPRPAEAYINNGIRKLAVHVENEINPVINMLVTPYIENTDYEYSLDEVLPLRQWKKYLKESVQINSLYLDGVPIPKFSGDTASYVVNDYETGEITYDAPSGIDVTVKQADELGDTAFVVAQSQKTGSKAVYSVTFSNDMQEMMNIGSYIPKECFTSLPSSTGSNVLDGDISTSWGADGECWVAFDLGEPKRMEEVKLIWSKGSERFNYFRIEVSDDKENWKTVFDGQSQLVADFAAYKFEPVTARYLRIYGTGNSDNNWVNLAEMRITSYGDAFKDISNHWAKSDIQNVANMGLVDGDSYGNFNPDNEISRAEFIAMIQKSVGYGNMLPSGKMADITSDVEHFGAIEGAYAIGIIPPEMIADGNFYPEKAIKCEEMLAIAALTCNQTNGLEPYYANIDNFPGKDLISAGYEKYIQIAASLKLYGGILAENGGIIPTSNATRAQAAVVLKRVYIKIH